MKKRTFFEKIKKSLNSIVVLTLLLPNIVSVGVAAAEELNSDEPQTENVEDITTEEENLEIETDADEDSEEPTVEEKETPPTPEPEEPVNEEELVKETSETPNVTQEDITEDAPVTIEETPLDTFTPTQVEEDQLGEPTEVNTHILVRAPNNMNSYSNTLNDFETHPLILTNQVTGETFSSSIRPGDGNTSNHFTLETTVHAYERGNEPSGRYIITLPQELIDLGYSLTRNHSVQSNFGIVGTTTLSYNAPQPSESVGQLSKNASDYGYLVGRDLGITLTTLDGQRTYSLGNTNLNIPSGEYNIRITNAPTDSRPQLIHRDSSLVNAPEREINLNQDGDAYEGTITLDFTNSTRPQVFKLSPIPVEGPHIVSIDPNGGTINDTYASIEVTEGDTYTVPYTFQSNLARPGYTLTGYTVEGTLLDANGNEVTELSRFTGVYTPMSDVTLTANWEVTSGGFRVQLYDDVPSTQKERYSLTLIAEDGTEYVLSSNQSGQEHRTWRVDDVPNGTYTLVIDGYNISEGEKFGQNDTTSDFVVNDDGTATVELGFVDNKSTTFIRYKVYGEPVPETNTVTIDPNGGTIDEAYATMEVTAGNIYTVPYTFQSNLALPGYTLIGYTVEGTLLDRNGNEVTELSRFTGDYTPMSDVTLTANWEITSGGFRIFDHIDNFITADRSFALTDGENTYQLTSNSYTNQSRRWEIDDVPNGVYTLLVDGLEYPNEWNFASTSSQSSATIGDDGEVIFDLTFADNSSTTFVRFDLTMNEYEVGAEVRDLNDRRTSDVEILVENEEGTVFEGSFDEYNLWTTDAEVLPGLYTITLTTPEGTVAEVNPTVALQSAEPTEEENVFTIEVNKENKGSLSRVFGAFRLVEIPEDIESHLLGIEIRDLDGLRTSDATIYVQNDDFVVFSGSYNQYAQWITDEELPVGEYTITLQTPENTYAVVQDTTQQHAVSTDQQNVFTILVNEENRGNLSAVYGAFQLVEMEYRLGVEVRGLDGKRTTDVGVVVTNEDEEVFEGAYNEYLQWLTEEELPAGEYSITLDTPEGTVAEIIDFTGNYAVPTDIENVFTIQLNETNLGSSSAIYGAFQLVEVPVEIEQYLLGIEVRDLNNLRTSEVGIIITNADGEVFTGDYNQYLQWLTDEELPVGEYTITLTTPEGTRAVINDTVASQRAIATDEENVFTILVNAENRGSLSAVYGAFRLVEVDEEEPTDPEEPVDPEEPTDPDDSTDPDDPDPEKPTDPEEPTDPEKPADPEDSSSDLPLTGVATSAAIGLGITSILSGLGLFAINKKREDE